jgi:hypothetical protein
VIHRRAVTELRRHETGHRPLGRRRVPGITQYRSRWPQELTLGTFTGPAGTFRQTAELTKPQPTSSTACRSPTPRRSSKPPPPQPPGRPTPAPSDTPRHHSRTCPRRSYPGTVHQARLTSAERRQKDKRHRVPGPCRAPDGAQRSRARARPCCRDDCGPGAYCSPRAAAAARWGAVGRPRACCPPRPRWSGRLPPLRSGDLVGLVRPVTTPHSRFTATLSYPGR